LILRDQDLEHSESGLRERTLRRAEVTSSACGTATEQKRERIFTLNGAIRPRIPIDSGERQFWRIVNASPDLYAGDHSPIHIVVDSTGPLAHHEVGKTLVRGLEASEPDFTVTFTEDKNGFYINGKKFSIQDEPLVRVRIGGLQHWRIVNSTREVHPFHIHQVHFLAYAENGIASDSPEWLDTVNVPYGGSHYGFYRPSDQRHVAIPLSSAELRG
jgi:hypothetical protein